MRGRILREVELIKKKYESVEYNQEYSWIMIKNIPLPKGWNNDHVDILIKVPSGYPTTAPDNFYADSKLRLENGGRPNRAPNDESIGGRNWIMFSFHFNNAGEWQPDAEIENGHNLLTYVEGVKGRLSEPD